MTEQFIKTILNRQIDPMPVYFSNKLDDGWTIEWSHYHCIYYNQPLFQFSLYDTKWLQLRTTAVSPYAALHLINYYMSIDSSHILRDLPEN